MMDGLEHLVYADHVLFSIGAAAEKQSDISFFSQLQVHFGITSVGTDGIAYWQL